MRNNSIDGNISFEPRIDSAAGDNPNGIALADLDGDKKPELIVANYYDRNLWVYRNMSSPGKILFAPKIILANGAGSRDIGVSDFDGDGKLDLAIATAPLIVLKNTSTGPGNFSFAAPFNSSISYSWSLDVGDVNGDGKADIIAANGADQTVSIIENTSNVGSISFAPRVIYPSLPNAYPRNAPLADLNNDGKMDFVLNNFNVQSITVFRNRMNTSPANAGIDTTICSGKTIQIGTPALSGHTYSWTSNPSGFTSSVASPVVAPAAATSYYLVVSNGSAFYYDTVAVLVKASPSVNAGPDKLICLGNAVSIGTPAVAGNSYLWSPATGLSSVTDAQPVASPAFSTSYYLTVSNSVGCSTKDTVTVLVTSALTLNVTPATPGICNGASVTLTASGPASSYTWSPATGLNTITGASVIAAPLSTTTYTVTGVNGSCTGTKSVTVTVSPVMTTSVLINYTGCPGNNLVFTATPINGGIAPQYQWYVNNVLASSQSSFTLNGATNGMQVYAKMTSTIPCALPQTVNSATTTINCIPTGIANIDALESFTVSPNPTNGLLVVQMKLSSMKKVSFEISDNDGRLIQETLPVNLAGTITKQLDLRGERAGIYYLKTTIGNKSFVEKIVVIP
jgi:hypothetical protein